MLSSVALRAQIASIINALSEAAVAEISKVVEDGMVVLRLETCQRESEIQKLKSNIEGLHAELRSLQGGESLRPADSQRAVGDERPLLDNGPAQKNHNHADRNGPSMPEVQVQVKCEPVEEGSEANRGRPAQLGDAAAAAASYDGDGAPWRPDAAAQVGRNNCGYLNLGQNSLPCLPDSSLSSSCSSAGFQHSPPSRGLPGYSQHRSSYSAVWRRTAAAKRFMFKKGLACPYCGKYFERAGHLERHKRIHTGEKPYRCEVCGRRFNQNCSLKEHLKIHERCIQAKRPPEMEVAAQKPASEGKPCPDAPRTQEAAQGKVVDVLPEAEGLLAPPSRVKHEPAEENIAPPPPFLGGGEQTRDGGGGDLSENFATFVSDGQQWASRLQSQSNAEIGGGAAAAQSTASFSGMAQLLPSSLDASCSTFSFLGKPYGELNGSAASQAPYGSSDTLLLPGDAGSHGTPPDPHRPRGSRSFQVTKPKKFFVCSYCGKVFERVGHLERHLRIHTGEKPYGCHVCGRCFNQKSSLKGHMKTHRNGENTDVLDTHHLMFPMPDNQPPKNPAEPKTGLASLEEQLLGAAAYGEAVGEQTVMVKLEPSGEDFLTPGQPASGGDRSSLWTPGNEDSGGGPDQTVRVLLHDVKFHQGYAAAAKLPFLGAKEQEEIMHNGQYVHSGRSLAPEPSVNDYAAASDGPLGGDGFEFNMAASGSHVDDCGAGGAVGGQNCFICSTCGQSFDCFGSFQRHQCANVPEQSFSCEICGEPFTQMSVLKLHLKLHVE